MSLTVLPRAAPLTQQMLWRSTPSYRVSIQSQLASQFAAFRSQKAYLSNGSNGKSPKPPIGKLTSDAPPLQNPSLGSLSFKDLGMSRTIKIIVIAVLSVFATIESIFWVKVAWSWISPSSEGESESGGS